MASPLIKPAALAALMGASGTGGYFGSKLISSKPSEKATPKAKFSVASLIAKDANKELLSKDNKNGQDADWKAAWGKYKNQNSSALSNGSDPWKIPNGTSGQSQSNENAPEAFMNKCVEESQKEVFDTSDPIYIRVYDWCTKDKVKAPASASPTASTPTVQAAAA
ncbi:hypothetical protein HF1_12030 [Mycoplasma haemofelis str. Langford 1]|uniref:Uncharacterized protein n=1 Tax=Mycoplasma haemofelis (strain Langford 1) TaxID=941640 RepID=E8ZJ90_MYCHL|nr:hypothetical protein [Mycoplasma haemofelis]CBY93211.1 hypothetical protein HF1_12030 [Mycoplasma haemofelis str. Langford 1]